MEYKNTVHGLWISGELSALELLTINSFLDKKYNFILWSYEPDFSRISDKVTLRDAAEIIPKDKIFSYSQKNQYGHGKGSFAGFSDIFRYKLLHEYGGWWTDMDITCLKRLPEDSDYIFRSDKSEQHAVGNLMLCPPRSELMRWCYHQAIQLINSENTNWTLPVKILNQGIRQFKLASNIRTLSNPDSWAEISGYMQKKVIPQEYYCVHWMHEEWRRLHLDKNTFPKKSSIYNIMKQYHVPIKIKTDITDILKYYFRTSVFYYILINLKYIRAFLESKNKNELISF